MATHRCEVLIVGGGILGLWVLDRLLDAGYDSPVLLESDLLGCRQTAHSDAFLHQGYAYSRDAGVQELIAAWNEWQPWLPPPTPPIADLGAHHVVFDPNVYQRMVAWSQGFQPRPGNPQYGAKHPGIARQHDAILTEEKCVPGDWIIGRLADGKESHIWKVRSVGDIALVRDPRAGRLRIESIDVVMGDGTPEKFEPDTLLLCAGEQNAALLDLSKVILPPGGILPAEFLPADLQHQSTIDMLVVRDSTDSLPAFNGSLSGSTVRDDEGNFWNVNAFVVSRRDLDGDLIWLVSGRIARTGKGPISHTTGRLLRNLLISSLCWHFPAFAQHHQDLTWGCYPARLTTLKRPSKALSRQTFTDMGIEGLLVCYTDRLTITPLAAGAIEQAVSSSLRPQRRHSIAPPKLWPNPVAIHPEYWRTPGRWEHRTSWKWVEFQANCL